MSIYFLVCIAGMIATIPFHFLSLEHVKLQEKYGRERGIRIGETIGMAQGWLFYIFWMGVWLSPQPRFTLPGPNLSVTIPIINFTIPILHVAVSIPFVASGAWLGIKGVQAVTLKVAERHRTERIVTDGVYSIVRHPQYLGGLLSHIGISILLSAWYSILSTPLIIAIIYLYSWKEEKELIREFGEEYEEYRRKVPMFIPRPGRKPGRVEGGRQGSLGEEEKRIKQEAKALGSSR